VQDERVCIEQPERRSDDEKGLGKTRRVKQSMRWGRGQSNVARMALLRLNTRNNGREGETRQYVRTAKATVAHR
jgi:hypothetical protein